MSTHSAEAAEALATFLKTMVDTERLQIAGALARQPQTAEQLAAQLKLKPATVARQLERLAEAGLLRSEVKGVHTRYALHLEAMRRLAGSLAPRPAPPELPGDLESYDREVLTNYLSADGSLKEIPMQDRKLLVILRFIAARIEAGRRYTEKQFNEQLARFHTDVAALRRYLVDYGFVQRTITGSEYWRE
jgi:DNA-binding HxlR family transcriptional regulator